MSADVDLLRDAAFVMLADADPRWHAVADLLAQNADGLDLHIPAWNSPSSGVDDPPALCWNDPERLAETVEHHYGRALAVARTFLRRDAGGSE